MKKQHNEQSYFLGGLISGVTNALGITKPPTPDQTQHNADREAARKTMTEAGETYNDVLKQQADTQAKRAEQEIAMSAQNNALMAAKIRAQMNADESKREFEDAMAKQAIERAKLLNEVEKNQFAEANKMKLIYLAGGGFLLLVILVIVVKALQ